MTICVILKNFKNYFTKHYLLKSSNAITTAPPSKASNKPCVYLRLLNCLSVRDLNGKLRK